MTAHLLRGDARMLPLADKSVQVVVTSPPYFGLRSYGGQASVWGGDLECPHEWGEPAPPRSKTGAVQTFNSPKMNPASLAARSPFAIATTATGGATCTICGAWRGELGSEPTPALFVAHLVEVCREVWRVLRDDGVCFLNIGDSYNSGTNAVRGPSKSVDVGHWLKDPPASHRTKADNVRVKSLLLVPERLAIALSDDGWIVRQVLIWSKNNPMPESVRDRWTTAHEYILMLVKQPRYFFDQAGIAEAVTESSIERLTQPTLAEQIGSERTNGHSRPERPMKAVGGTATRNGRSVWNINTIGYPGAHYATFNPELPRRCILAATSEYGACAACGAPWRRDTERQFTPQPDVRDPAKLAKGSNKGMAAENGWGSTPRGTISTTTTGWQPTCKCGSTAGVRPCIVADIFSGSGTTAYVAASLGRVGVGVELSPDYIAQARYGRLAQEFLPLGVGA